METKDVYVKNKYPVTVEGMTITAYMAFHKDLQKPAADCDDTYAKLAYDGIKENWEEAGFKVDIRVVDIKDKRPHVNILPAKVSQTSYVMSRWYRWGWGLFRCSLHPESFMLNWSLKNPGNIHLNIRRYRTKGHFKRMAAHEFGHVLGLGDAYAANYRFYYEAPDTKNYMMNRNVRVSEEEVQMVLKAHKTGKMQYFPMEVSLKRFFKGLVKH